MKLLCKLGFHKWDYRGRRGSERLYVCLRSGCFVHTNPYKRPGRTRQVDGVLSRHPQLWHGRKLGQQFVGDEDWFAEAAGPKDHGMRTNQN